MYYTMFDVAAVFSDLSRDVLSPRRELPRNKDQ